MRPENDEDWRATLIGEDGLDEFCDDLDELTRRLQRKAASRVDRVRIMENNPLSL